MAVYAANRLQAILPQIAALNAAGKSQADAAAALGVSLNSVRNWAENTGIQWKNLDRRGPYKRLK
jgi:transposase